MKYIRNHGKEVPLDSLLVINKRTGCWLWAGEPNQSGYGRIYHDGKRHLAHRFVFGYAGPLCVLHSCDTPRCVCPDHLRVGTHAENMDDAVTRNRFPKRTAAKHGKYVGWTDRYGKYIPKHKRTH